MKLVELKKVGASNIIRVKMQNDESEQFCPIDSFTKSEMNRLEVVWIVATSYPMFPNVLEVTVKGDLYIGIH